MDDPALEYIPIVEAAGLLTPDMNSFQVFLLAGRLMDDKVVEERAMALGCEPGTCATVADTEDFAEIIQKMTPQEKAELLQRIGR